MSTQTLCIMANCAPGCCCYPLEKSVFGSGSSDEDDDKDDDASEDNPESTEDMTMHPTLEKKEEQQSKKESKYEKHTVFKEDVPVKYDEEIKPLEPTPCVDICARRRENVVMVALRTFKRGVLGIISLTLHTLLNCVDFLINLCFNEGVRDVVLVTLTVTIEVFVIMVFAVATIMASIIVNIDDAYNRRHDVRFSGSERPEHVEDEALPIKQKVPKTRPLRVKKKTYRRSSKLSNVALLEYDENIAESDASAPERLANEDPKSKAKKSLTSEYSENDKETAAFKIKRNKSLSFQDSLNGKKTNKAKTSRSSSPASEDTVIETKKFKFDESFTSNDSDNQENNKPSKTYSNKLPVIQDNENSTKNKENEKLALEDFDTYVEKKETTETKIVEKESVTIENIQCTRRSAPLHLNKDFDSGVESKKSQKNLKESPSSYVENKTNSDSTCSECSCVSNTSSQAETDSIDTNQPEMSESSESRIATAKFEAESLMSFVSTKRLFENNNSNNNNKN